MELIRTVIHFYELGELYFQFIEVVTGDRYILHHIKSYIDFRVSSCGGRLMMRLYEESHDRITRNKKLPYGTMPYNVPLCARFSGYWDFVGVPHIRPEIWHGDWEDDTEYGTDDLLE